MTHSRCEKSWYTRSFKIHNIWKQTVLLQTTKVRVAPPGWEVLVRVKLNIYSFCFGKKIESKHLGGTFCQFLGRSWASQLPSKLFSATIVGKLSIFMSRKVLATISLVIEAGCAKPSPPVGPALGGHGLNILSFCKEFNARTAEIKQNVPVPVKLTAFTDKSFEWSFSSPPASFLLLKAAGISSGSSKPGHARSGTISLKHLYEIAKVKKSEKGNEFVPLQSICSSIIGSSKSMGLFITTWGGRCVFKTMLLFCSLRRQRLKKRSCRLFTIFTRTPRSSERARRSLRSHVRAAWVLKICTDERLPRRYNRTDEHLDADGLK